MPTVNCKVCGIEIHRPPSQILPDGNTCSRECRNVAQSVPHSKVEAAIQLRADTGLPAYKIAKLIGISPESCYKILGRNGDKLVKTVRVGDVIL